ncbi:MAG: MBL fold metallo-hydrolase [Candidatus Caldarchaeum sp.]
MKLTVYGGAGQIGGNKILLEGRRRVFLDFGVDFTTRSRFFSTFLQPRRFALVRDYVATGVLPALKGLYEKDGTAFAEAVVITHGHLDHYGHASLLRPDIPLYMGETTRLLIKARETTKQKSPENLFNKNENHPVEVFRTGSRLVFEDVVIHPVHVDHSIPAAYGLVIETGEGVLAYTGDLRMHGPKAEMTHDFVEKCVKMNVETLVIEGTRLDETDVSSESDVKKELARVLSKAGDKLVSVVVAMMDFDRLNSVLSVAEDFDRVVAISLHHANLLTTLKTGGARMNIPELRDDKLAAFLERRRTGTYSKTDYPSWQTELIDRIPTVGDEEIRREQKKYLLVLSRAEDIIKLSDIAPAAGSPFILSTSEAHSEEQMLEEDRIHNWVNLLNLRYEHIHSSGHAPQKDLLKIIEEIGPRKVIPVHTHKPEMMKHLLNNSGLRPVVEMPVQGRAMDVF